MLIERPHLELILAIKENKPVSELKKVVGDANERLKELFIMGFAEPKKGRFELTSAGEKLAEIAQELIEKIKDKDLQFVFGQELIEILKVFKKTGYLPKYWAEYLKERGLYENEEKLSELAEKLLEAYNESLKYLKFEVPSEVLSFLLAIAPGPAELRELIRASEGYRKDIIKHAAMLKLLTFSIDPNNGKIVYQLTPSARILVNLMGDIYLENISERLIKNLQKEEKERSEQEKEELEERGLTEEGQITEAGSKLLKARELLGKELPVPIPYFILNEEIQLMKLIKNYWEKYRQHGTDDLIPDEELVFRKAEEELKFDRRFTDFLINLLFVKDYIKNVMEKRTVAFDITEKGKEVMNLFDDKRDVITNASKAVLYGETDKAPIYSWLEEAHETDLIKGWLTKRGRKIVELALEPRKMLLTKYALIAIYKIPRNKYITMDDLVQEVLNYLSKEERDEEKIEERIKEAISQAEAYGLFLIERNNTVILTDVGEKIKEMLENARAD
ncbi:MAG: DUF505 family protein, partial [Nanoarchaeota archaeon]